MACTKLYELLRKRNPHISGLTIRFAASSPVNTFFWQAPQTQVTLGLPESKALARQHILACLSHCGVKEMLFFHWFYKGKQETIRIPCSPQPRFMGPRGFSWRTIENARDFNDSQGFCSRIRWRPKSAISFPHRLLCPKSLFSNVLARFLGDHQERFFFGKRPLDKRVVL